MKDKLAIAASILNKVKLPKISNEVAQLQEESMRPDPDVNVIAKCINRNPRLFTKFIAVASFISKKEIQSARQAVDILGTKGVFTVFFSSAIEFSFQSNKENETIINHAIKVATAMSDLASGVEGVKSGDAYLYGLLYNAGYIALNQYNPTACKECYLTSLMTPSFSTQKEMELFGTTSSCIGVYVAKKWHVKNSVYSGILFQQDEPAKCPDGRNLAYELINMLNVARMVVAEAEDNLYLTDEVRQRALLSMQNLVISNRDYIRAQKRVIQYTKDLRSFPKNTQSEESEAGKVTQSIHLIR
ncbi:MAG: HDOD domain-containing protein [Thiomicrorhabdus chilensis]|uniref:HDOD domain-containing protein n=1 Tax=Thiomicrorhabdus chilensis TaxID=63656 RepID=UPI00299CE180|nr:HDOD domain-containing protein [Thiomicrorhabdus chilensis]MDX1346798.1 HDOD domain-containing protein [Thiomicrorhabdus chilensis]